MKKSTITALIAVLVLAVGVGAFELGMYAQRVQRQNAFRQFSGGQFNGGGMPGGGMRNGQGQMPPGAGNADNRARMGNMMITGTVDLVKDNTITITTRFGSQKITLSDKAKVGKMTTASKSDIKKGTEIIVQSSGGNPGEALETSQVYVIK